MTPEPGTPDFRRWARRWPRDIEGRPGHTWLVGDAALLLHFPGADPPQPFTRHARVVVAADRPVRVPGATIVARLPLREITRRKTAAALGEIETREAVLLSLDSASPGPLLAAIRAGIRLFHVFHSAGASFPAPAHSALMLVTVGWLSRRAARLPGATWMAGRWLRRRLAAPELTIASSRRSTFVVLRSSLARPTPTPCAGSAPRVTHYIGTLGSGGAERQLTYLVASAPASAPRPSVLTVSPPTGALGHYRQALENCGARIDSIRIERRRRSFPELRAPDGRAVPPELIEALDRHGARAYLLGTAQHLLEHRPDVLHCWLDESNVVGALAALVADVPLVVLSTRNLSPRHFPHLERPWFRDAYRALSLSPRIRFIANSRAGALDYAEWLRLPVDRFAVVPNGLPTTGLETTDAATRLRRRAELDLPESGFVLVGVFRLSAEKRPLDFLEVAARVAAELPELTVVHVGTGPEEDAVRRAAAALGLESRLRFAGRVDDPSRYLAAADLSLLTSGEEGCPNVSLESQAIGIPMILTRAGGAPETVLDGESGLVRDVGDVEGIAAAVIRLARDPGLRRRMGDRGARFVRDHFSVERMVERTHAIYRLGPDGGT